MNDGARQKRSARFGIKAGKVEEVERAKVEAGKVGVATDGGKRPG